jgi:hypothetical protein
MKAFRKNIVIGLAAIMLSYVPVNAQAQQPVTFYGKYSHVETGSGEHCDGYTIELWNYDGAFTGLIHHHRGLCGDPPVGILENVHYEAKTGRLLFQAKLSDGWNNDGPTKDTVSFNGSVMSGTLRGEVFWHRAGQARHRFRENITLDRESDAYLQGKAYATFSDWMQAQQPILRFRGPKW